MDNKIYEAVQKIGSISTILKDKVGEIFNSPDSPTWTSKLVQKSSFLIVKPSLLENSWLFISLYNLMDTDNFAISIFKNLNSPSPTDYKFCMITSLSVENESITFMREKNDGTLDGVATDTTSNFLNTHSGYEYAFSFLLNDADIFPTFDIKDFSTGNAVSRTYSIKDLLSYLNFCYEDPIIETEEFKLNLFAIRSNFGFEQDAGEWKYKKRSTFQDHIIIFYLENKKWVVKIFDFTTLPDVKSKKCIERNDKKECTKRTFSLYTDTRNANDLGIPVIAPGQYKDAYIIGKHGRSSKGGGYRALEQHKILSHYRDTSVGRTGYYDFIITSKKYGKINREGVVTLPKLNLHTNCPSSNSSGKISVARSNGSEIAGYSAGCQVIALPKGNNWNDVIMDLADQQEDKTGVNTFTYTLIEGWDFIQYMTRINGED